MGKLNPSYDLLIYENLKKSEHRRTKDNWNEKTVRSTEKKILMPTKIRYQLIQTIKF